MLDPIQLKEGKTIYPIIVTTDYSYTDKSGAHKYFEEDNYVVFWNALGKAAFTRISVGALIYIEGRLQTRFWKDEDETPRHEINILSEKYIVLSTEKQKIY